MPEGLIGGLFLALMLSALPATVVALVRPEALWLGRSARTVRGALGMAAAGFWLGLLGMILTWPPSAFWALVGTGGLTLVGGLRVLGALDARRRAEALPRGAPTPPEVAEVLDRARGDLAALESAAAAHPTLGPAAAEVAAVARPLIARVAAEPAHLPALRRPLVHHLGHARAAVEAAAVPDAEPLLVERAGRALERLTRSLKARAEGLDRARSFTAEAHLRLLEQGLERDLATLDLSTPGIGFPSGDSLDASRPETAAPNIGAPDIGTTESSRSDPL
ncbi:hypothetical protein [Roseospirillum parvum]|uniref:5-bromo-4-chloroindolyl phosphate hydrolysis protein n=1 Tax=Roseospirillum parvum TaxID=83401 RepID=A0A1G7UVU3_9PROT|nr:hypothetical protein [Roseospirillum parvum]SDG51626.1 hypothetical protein SAMN05421742_101449 [Roseospirillum parvum]